MYLITSGAYIAQDLQSEFGALPPAFLPAGNCRLFHHQLARIPSSERIVMTVPERFRPGQYDLTALRERRVELLYIPEHLSLGASVVYALNLLDVESDKPLRILHGDTLFDSLPQGEDQVGISQVEDNYNWAEYNQDTGLMRKYDVSIAPTSNMIVNGYFCFSKPRNLIRELTIANGCFIEGLNGYHRSIGLSPVLCQDWYDFGHSHTYYQSKSRMTTQRAFNEMRVHGQIVTKASRKKRVLEGEAYWYKSLPGDMRVYAPSLLSNGESEGLYEYSIEYLHLTALNEIYVFSSLPAFAWNKILRACCDFLDKARTYQTDNKKTLDALFTQKTQSRLQEYDTPCNLDRPLIVNNQLKPSIYNLAKFSEEFLPEDDGHQNLLHGDFCFSNVLYDFRTGNVKVIDPRGLDGDDRLSIYGNSCYDIAKLSHSIIGLYDVIIAGYFQASIHDQKLDFSIDQSPERDKVIEIFCELMMTKYSINRQQLYAMQIQLFLSMLPLHNDKPERQLGFIGNAYRLYDLITGADA